MKRKPTETIEAFRRRKRLNHTRVCWCMGWWFPHRSGSKASQYTLETRGTYGCYYWYRLWPIQQRRTHWYCCMGSTT